MSTVYEKFLEGITSGEVPTASTFKVRSETAQSKIRVRALFKFKKDFKVSSRLFIPMELSFPFNPLTGNPDGYHDNNRWRTTFSATTTALIIKAAAVKNPELAQFWAERAKIEAWDLSQPDVFTEQDWKIFKRHRVLRIFTVNAMSIRDKRVTGSKFGGSYLVDVKRDELGEVVVTEKTPYPKFLKLQKMLRDLAYIEAEDIKSCAEAGKKGIVKTPKAPRPEFAGHNLATIEEDKLKDLLRDYIYSDVFITEDYPMNFVTGFQIPLSGRDLTVNLAELNAEDFGKMLGFSKITKNLREMIESIQIGSLDRQDVHFDFFEFDLVGPNSPTENVDKDADLGQNTSYSVSSHRLTDTKFVDTARQLVRECLDNDVDIEKRFLVSSRIKKYDAALEERILTLLEDKRIIDSPYATDDFLLNNAEMITEIYGNDGDFVIAATESGLSDRGSANYDPDSAKSESAENLRAFAEGAADDEEESEEAEETSTATGGENAAPADAVGVEEIEI